MRGKLKNWCVLTLIISLILFVLIGSSEAFYPYLSEEQIEKAIQYGKDK